MVILAMLLQWFPYLRGTVCEDNRTASVIGHWLCRLSGRWQRQGGAEHQVFTAEALSGGIQSVKPPAHFPHVPAGMEGSPPRLHPSCLLAEGSPQPPSGGSLKHEGLGQSLQGTGLEHNHCGWWCQSCTAGLFSGEHSLLRAFFPNTPFVPQKDCTLLCSKTRVPLPLLHCVNVFSWSFQISWGFG